MSWSRKVFLPILEVKEVATSALVHAGVRADNAETQIRLWLEAELRGHPSHGLLRLSRIVERIANGVANPITKGHHEWKGEAFLSVDGENGLGPVVAQHALDAVSERSRTTGVAMAAISNNNHLGMLAIYAEDIARKGQIMIGITTSEALVHPWGGRRAMIGTNPVTIGVPADPHPFILDMATGLISMGKVHDYANRDKQLEPGWALDEKGNPTLNPSAAKSGAIAPFGENKGYALGLAFEVLVASLTNSALGHDVTGTLDSTEVCNKGDIFIVAEARAGQSAISSYLDLIRTSAPTDPANPVRVPGDRTQRTRNLSQENGVNIAPEIWTQIRSLAAQPDLISAKTTTAHRRGDCP